jgi:hypothetical protein
MTDFAFHKKPDTEVNKLAADLLGMHDAHAVAERLNHTDLNRAAVIKEMEAQRANLGENLPPLVITGIAEHLAQEAKDRNNISAEYNAMKSLADKQGVAHELERDKALIINERPDQTLQQVELKRSDNVTQIVYQASETADKVRDAGKKTEDQGVRILKKINPFGK